MWGNQTIFGVYTCICVCNKLSSQIWMSDLEEFSFFLYHLVILRYRCITMEPDLPKTE